MKIRVLSTVLIITMLLLPVFVQAEEKEAQEVQQIPIINQNYEYTENVTDFRDEIAKYDPIWKTGIYSGPHLPPVKFAVQYLGETLLTINFSLAFDVFTYGASDYYFYLPILNSPETVQFFIKISNSTDYTNFLSDDFFGLTYQAYNYSVLSTHDFIKYYPELGYVIHEPFFPLRSGIEYTINIRMHFLTSDPLILYLSQTNLSILQSTELEIASSYDPVTPDELEGVAKEIANIPIAFAFLATEGLTQFGVGAVQLPGSLGLVMRATDMPVGQYATLDMPYHLPTPGKVVINYTYSSSSGIESKQINAFVKNFVICSTDTKIYATDDDIKLALFRVYPPSINQSYVIFISTQKSSYYPYSFRIYLYDRIITDLIPNPAPWYSSRDWLYSSFGDHIVTSVKPTENRYVPLNSSSWTLSRLQFSKLALQNAILLQYYDIETMVPVATLAGTVAKALEAKELIAIGAHKINSPHVGFKTFLSLPHIRDALRDIGKIIWQTLLRFWNYITRELNLFWSWIAPVLQLAIYFIFIISIMMITKYLSKLFVRRDENEAI